LSASAFLAEQFTLIIPTYNRPPELARLLTFLARLRINFPVLVLDSSEPTAQQANRYIVDKSGLNIRYEVFTTDISPWLKFLNGSEMVRTPYCAFCADDDVVLPDSLETIVRYLESHPDFSVAHGWYCTFYNTSHIGITSSVYRGPSLDQEDPLARLLALMKNYEAVTYGVYRTGVMQRVLRDVQGVDSLVCRELLGGALAVAMGKIARLPVFYYCRSLGPSNSHNHWHPLDILISAPDKLYSDYAAYRVILLNHLKSKSYNQYPEPELVTLIDLIHFRYLSDYVKPPVMEYLIEQVMARKPKPEIMQGVWSKLAQQSSQPVVRYLSGNRLLRKLRDRFFPGFRLHDFRRLSVPTGQRKMRSITADGRSREYVFFQEFLEPFASMNGLEQEISKIVSTLDNYG
jgi:glycosyltransferase domain-containing protein